MKNNLSMSEQINLESLVRALKASKEDKDFDRANRLEAQFNSSNCSDRKVKDAIENLIHMLRKPTSYWDWQWDDIDCTMRELGMP